MKKALYLLTFVLFHTAFSQSYVDLFRLDCDYSFPRPFEGSNVNGELIEYSADLTLPVVINPKLNLITGINAEWVNVTLNPDDSKTNFAAYMLKLGANVKHTDRLAATYILLPKLASNQIAFRNDNFQLGGIALFKIHKTENLNYKFGAYVNSEFFGPFVVPIFGLYRKNEKFETNLTLPINADFNFSISPSTKLGLKFTGLNKSFFLDENPDQYMVKINNEIGPYIMLGKDRLRFQVQAGMGILRSYRTYDTNDKLDYAISLIRPGDNRVQLNTDFKDGFFIKSSFIYRFTIGK